jgi:hypothetical protein
MENFTQYRNLKYILKTCFYFEGSKRFQTNEFLKY